MKKLTPQSDRARTSQRPTVACQRRPGPIFFFLPLHFFLLHPFLGALVDSTSWALKHARPAQTSPKDFKHPLLLIHRSKNYEIYTHAKLIARRIFTKSFKKSKNNMRLSDSAQNRFGHSIYTWSFSD
jgi:hypothetical protein